MKLNEEADLHFEACPDCGVVRLSPGNDWDVEPDYKKKSRLGLTIVWSMCDDCTKRGDE